MIHLNTTCYIKNYLFFFYHLTGNINNEFNEQETSIMMQDSCSLFLFLILMIPPEWMRNWITSKMSWTDTKIPFLHAIRSTVWNYTNLESSWLANMDFLNIFMVFKREISLLANPWWSSMLLAFYFVILPLFVTSIWPLYYIMWYISIVLLQKYYTTYFYVNGSSLS